MMKRKRSAIAFAQVSALLCGILLACFALTWFSLTFEGASSDGQQTAIVYLSNLLIFGSLVFLFTALLGVVLGWIFGLVLDVLNRWIVPSRPNVKLKYHLRLLLWAFAYNLLLTVPFMDFDITDGIVWPLEIFIPGFCFWGVISQILASEYLKNGKSVEASEQDDNMKPD